MNFLQFSFFTKAASREDEYQIWEPGCRPTEHMLLIAYAATDSINAEKRQKELVVLLEVLEEFLPYGRVGLGEVEGSRKEETANASGAEPLALSLPLPAFNCRVYLATEAWQAEVWLPQEQPKFTILCCSYFGILRNA